jgi:hypothetical protein
MGYCSHSGWELDQLHEIQTGANQYKTPTLPVFSMKQQHLRPVL